MPNNEMSHCKEVLEREKKDVIDNLDINCREKNHNHSKCELCDEERELEQALNLAIQTLDAVISAGEELPPCAVSLYATSHEAKAVQEYKDLCKPILAKLKLEKEQVERRVEEQKKIRIKYQDIVYKICLLFDKRYEKCTFGEVVDKVKELQAQNKKLEETIKHMQVNTGWGKCCELNAEITRLKYTLHNRNEKLSALRKKDEEDEDDESAALPFDGGGY